MDYAAAADALTYAPEELSEFFNQRRRWVTSTLVSQMDLLNSFKNIIQSKDNISYIYIIYQFIVMVTTFLCPATVVLGIATSFKSVLDVKAGYAYLMSIIPVAFFLIITFRCKTSTQLIIAAILSAFYACVMVVVLVGIIASLATDNILDPTLLFLMILTATSILGGLLHPYEFWCLPSGVLYFLCIPASYIILTIYSFSNMNVMCWGTREMPKYKTKKQLEQEEEEKKAKEEKQKRKDKKGILSFLRIDKVLNEMRDMVMQMFNSKNSSFESQQLRQMERITKQLKSMKKSFTGKDEDEDVPFQTKEVMPSASASKTSKSKPKASAESKSDEEEKPEVEDPDNPWWSQDLDNDDYKDVPGGAETGFLDPDELQFWVKFIRKYERPLKVDKQEQMKLSTDLLKIRNNVNLAMWFINGLWILFVFMIEQKKEIKSIPIQTYEIPATGLVFLAIVFVALTLQVIGMVMHRWGTFLQLMSITELTKPWKNIAKVHERSVEELIELTKDLGKGNSQYFVSEPDYDIDDENMGNGIPDINYNMRGLTDTLRHHVQTRGAIPWHQTENHHIPNAVGMYDPHDNIENGGLKRQKSMHEPGIHHHEGVSRNLWNQIHQNKHHRRHHDESRSGRHAPERRPHYRKHNYESRNDDAQSEYSPHHSTNANPRRKHRHHRKHGDHHHHHEGDDGQHHRHYHEHDSDQRHHRHQRQKKAFNFDRMFDYRLDKFFAHNGGSYI